MTKSLTDLLQQSSNSNKTLAIGHPDGEDSRNTLTIPYSARSAHMHVIGQTRSGKNRFLADLIRQDITNRNGVCLIDPHGELYQLTINWLAQNKLIERIQPNIHPICLTDPDSLFRYNPLHIEHPSEAYTVASNVTETIVRIYGGKDSNETPLFTFVLNTICTILALRGLPLASAQHFLLNDSLDKEIRKQIVSGVPDEYYRHLGQQLSQLGAKEFRETVGSTARRLHEFLRNPMVRRIFSTTENTLPLKDIMDGRHVLLIDASDQGGKITNKELRTIGSLFVNNIFYSARKRDHKDNPIPFMVYIDEVQNYINNDIEDILSQSAKRGLYLTLAHQFLSQLTDAGDLVYKGVMSGTLIKAVFGITMEEADVLVDELFADQIDPQRVKKRLASPHAVGHKKTLLYSNSESHSTAQNTAQATSESYEESDNNEMAETSSYSQLISGDDFGSGGEILSHTVGESNVSISGYTTSSSASKSFSFGESEAHATGTTEAETLKPVIEWFSTQAYTLEEQRYLLKRQLALQPQRHGYLAVLKKGTRGFTARHIPDMLYIPQKEALLLERLRNKSAWISSTKELSEEIPHEQALDQRKQKKEHGTKPKPDDSFEEF